MTYNEKLTAMYQGRYTIGMLPAKWDEYPDYARVYHIDKYGEWCVPNT